MRKESSDDEALAEMNAKKKKGKEGASGKKDIWQG